MKRQPGTVRRKDVEGYMWLAVEESDLPDDADTKALVTRMTNAAMDQVPLETRRP